MGFLSSKITVFLILLNVVLFVLETMDGGSTNMGVALRYGALYPPFVRQGQYHRYLSSMFLHFGIYHLLLNMYALSMLGPAVEHVCGPVNFLMVYLASGLAGNIATMIYYQNTGRDIVSAGASGCIFGLLGACFVFAVAGYGFSLRSIMVTIMINLIYGLLSRRINMVAHVGGFIDGALVTALVLLV